jgi:hypothetical protein
MLQKDKTLENLGVCWDEEIVFEIVLSKAAQREGIPPENVTIIYIENLHLTWKFTNPSYGDTTSAVKLDDYPIRVVWDRRVHSDFWSCLRIPSKSRRKTGHASV